MNLAETRSALTALLVRQQELSESLDVDATPVADLRAALGQGELSVAVVGEVNRGKSTFLNALLGARVFPSRVAVCTAGITVLTEGPPSAEVVFRDGKTEAVDLDAADPAGTLTGVVSRRNADVQKIEAVRVRYPNPFTKNGVVLVDTPGVNDPESWREDITYTYLANADAVVMLLDPLQPLSASEVEFLRTKILKRSIANLIFVVNKMDDVGPSDRAGAIGRVRDVLSRYVPNPTIYPVAAKPALAAKLAGDDEALKATGLPAFEEGLLTFLGEGRGGALLRTKVHQALAHLASVESGVAARLGALDSEEGDVRADAKAARSRLGELKKRRDTLARGIDRAGGGVEAALKVYVSKREGYVDQSLVPALRSEADPDRIRERVLSFQRDTVEGFQAEAERAYSELLEGAEGGSAALTREVMELLGDVRRQADNTAKGLSLGPAADRGRAASGAAVGGALGAAAGVGLAATATTTTLVAVPTAYGAAYGVATTAAFSTAGVLGIGVLTGGLGLLLGLGAAALLSKGRGPKSGGYVSASATGNESAASEAIEGFLKGLRSRSKAIAESLVSAAKSEVLGPVERALKSQQVTISQVEGDLDRTVEEQADLRDVLGRAAGEIGSIRAGYGALT